MASTPQDFTSGLVLTDTMVDKLPQGVLDKQSSTASLGPTSGTTELTLLTAAAITPAQANRRFRLMFHTRGLSGTVNADVYIFRFKEGATVLNETHYTVTAAGAVTEGRDIFHILEPSVAAHTYSVTVQRSSGSGTTTISATATAPILLSLIHI